jgi:hypothetical protein
MTGTEAQAHKQDVGVLYDSEVKEFPYKEHEKVTELLERAKHAFGVVSNHLLSLFAPNGGELPDDKSLAAAGEELVLGQSVVKGG